jgi:hypothetical protein
VVLLTGFVRSQTGLEYALVQDATGKTAAEIHEMGPWDRAVTAMLRMRFYRERNKQSERASDKMH